MIGGKHWLYRFQSNVAIVLADSDVRNAHFNRYLVPNTDRAVVKVMRHKSKARGPVLETSVPRGFSEPGIFPLKLPRKILERGPDSIPAFPGYQTGVFN